MLVRFSWGLLGFTLCFLSLWIQQAWGQSPLDESASANAASRWDMQMMPLFVGVDEKSPLLVTAATSIPGTPQLLVGGQRAWGVYSIENPSWIVHTSELVSIHDVAFSPDGLRLLIAGGTPAQSGAVELWDWSAQQKLSTMVVHEDVVYAVDWSPSGEYWCTAAADQKCQVFSSDRRKVSEFASHSKAVLDAEFLKTESGELQIVSAGVDTTIQVWNALDGQRARTLENHTQSVQQLVVLPRDSDASQLPQSSLARLISIGQDKTVRLWQPTIGRLVRFGKTTAKPSALALGEASQLWVGCADGSLWLFATDTMTPVWNGSSPIGIIRVIVPMSEHHVWVAGTHGNLLLTKR